MESRKKIIAGVGAAALLVASGIAYSVIGKSKTPKTEHLEEKVAEVRTPIESCILAIDQGTTSTRVLVVDHNLHIVDVAQYEHDQVSTKPGWVDHVPEEIYANVR